MSNPYISRRNFKIKLALTASVVIVGLILIVRLDVFTRSSSGNFAKVLPKYKETIYDGV